MMMAGLPCAMAHTPKRLEKLAAEALSIHILSSGISNCYDSYIQIVQENGPDPEASSYYNIDRVITAPAYSEFGGARNGLLNRLSVLKRYWEREDVFGPTNSIIRRLINDAMQHLFDQMDDYFKSPILMFTLQLCFSTHAGYFNKPFIQMNLKLPKIGCKPYADFLLLLAPFNIQFLNDTSIVFGTPEPLMVILKSSPKLKALHLRNNVSDYVANAVGRYCPGLRSFIIEELLGKPLVSEEYLYKTFFKGREKQDVIAYVDKKDELEVSFKDLTSFDIGKSKRTLDCLFYIQYFYGNQIKSMSCHSENFTVDWTYMNIPMSLMNKINGFSFIDLTLSSQTFRTYELESLIDGYSSVKHVSLTLEELEELDRLYEDHITRNATVFMKNLSVKSFTVLVEFNSPRQSRLFDVFSTILEEIGKQLTSLQFFIRKDIDWNFIVDLVNKCPDLDTLVLNFQIDTVISNLNTKKKFKTLKNIRNLSIFYDDVARSTEFFEQISSIITQAAHLKNLELFLPHTACNWIMSIAANGSLANLEKLVLGLQYIIYMLEPDIDLYVPVVEALTNLKMLVLVKVPDVILSHMKRVFDTSCLQIKSDCYSSIAYQGLCSRYKI